jgi:hypothetical protein
VTLRAINRPLRTSITQTGQAYVDEAVYVEVSKAKPLAYAISAALNERPIPALIQDLSHYEHIRLRWTRPQGQGAIRS